MAKYFDKIKKYTNRFVDNSVDGLPVNGIDEPPYSSLEERGPTEKARSRLRRKSGLYISLLGAAFLYLAEPLVNPKEAEAAWEEGTVCLQWNPIPPGENRIVKTEYMAWREDTQVIVAQGDVPGTQNWVNIKRLQLDTNILRFAVRYVYINEFGEEEATGWSNEPRATPFVVGDVAPPYGVVDLNDYLEIRSRRGAVPGDPKWSQTADVNGTKEINEQDETYPIINWGFTYTTPFVDNANTDRQLD